MVISDWKMYYKDYPALSCKAPCSMYSVLLEHQLIPDPFTEMNDVKLTALSDEDCVFESSFFCDEKLLQNRYVELNPLGLDTICSIYLNGSLVAKTINMHRAYRFDAKPFLQEGENTIRLEFGSPTAYFKKMYNRYKIFTNGDTIPGAPHLRKALYMSGWDWGPTLPDMGIFRPVLLDAYNTDKLDTVSVIQHHGENTVVLDITAKTLHPCGSCGCDIYVTIDGQRVKLENGRGKVTITDPKLWWVRGYGEQPLYELVTELVQGDAVIDSKTEKIGLRTLTVSTEDDSIGSEFCFMINGVRIFAMGANYIPQDNLISRVTDEKVEQLIRQCAEENFNCIRVWGGGYYPEEHFYELCDQYGFIVWQDFMCACMHVRLRDEFVREFSAEAAYQIARIRNHASLGILCGNNEIEVGLNYWDVCKENPGAKVDYLKLFEHILADICDEMAPDIFYWPSSPSSGGGLYDPRDETKGDCHYWDVWHGSLPYTDYRKHNFRFCSEFGFESYPCMKTIRSFCEEKDMNCFSRVMEDHQKCEVGNSKILMYIADNYLYPSDFEKLVYTSQLIQADAIKFGVEHFRRIRGVCMGSLIWQLNDCWPVASWSAVDWFGRPKALHYAAKKFYAPVALALVRDDNQIIVNVQNETRETFRGQIRVVHADTDLNEIESCTREISLNPLTSRDVLCHVFAPKDPYREFVFVDLLDADGNFIMRQTEIFVKPKHFAWQDPQITVKAEQAEGGVMLTFTAEAFAKGVSVTFADLDCPMSDNFFDLTDHTPYQVMVQTDCTPDELIRQMTLMTVYDIGR